MSFATDLEVRCCSCHWLVCTGLSSQPFSVFLQIAPALLQARVAHWGWLQAAPAWGAARLWHSECTHRQSCVPRTVGFVPLWTRGFPELSGIIALHNSTNYPVHLFNPLVFQLKRGVTVNQKTSEAWVDPWSPKAKFFSSLFFRFGLCLVDCFLCCS